MKLESCVILKLFVNFSDSEPFYSYKHSIFFWPQLGLTALNCQINGGS